MTWAELSWNDEHERQRRRANKPPNRRTVEVVTCPTCQGTHVRRKSVEGHISYWICLAEKNCPRWKEVAGTGDAGTAIIA